MLVFGRESWRELERVTVIGCGLVGGGGLVVTAEAKAALVARLQDVHFCHVFAFGDGHLDLQMLSKVGHAIVMVGEEPNVGFGFVPAT